MTASSRLVLMLIAAFVIVYLTISTEARDRIGTCIRNCAQCKKMFGPYFEGQLCAESCLKFKGKLIPDCEDADSIAPYIHPLEED